jgi:hypothetical protein
MYGSRPTCAIYLDDIDTGADFLRSSVSLVLFCHQALDQFVAQIIVNFDPPSLLPAFLNPRDVDDVYITLNRLPHPLSQILNGAVGGYEVVNAFVYLGRYRGPERLQ